ncbi:hypothetical protein OLMES_4906 [Oleiphilus messinensis]|uniref:Uncharacterized protein n=1 Tax=Oleiphilus messinensis TaxID=141451 RepID=A0A1Y0IHN1_9GAMM|nr:hypothetical protein OLMES_4906 [Oleiphilus messinensis]
MPKKVCSYIFRLYGVTGLVGLLILNLVGIGYDGGMASTVFYFAVQIFLLPYHITLELMSSANDHIIHSWIIAIAAISQLLVCQLLDYIIVRWRNRNHIF